MEKKVGRPAVHNIKQVYIRTPEDSWNRLGEIAMERFGIPASQYIRQRFAELVKEMIREYENEQ